VWAALVPEVSQAAGVIAARARARLANDPRWRRAWLFLKRQVELRWRIARWWWDARRGCVRPRRRRQALAAQRGHKQVYFGSWRVPRKGQESYTLQRGNSRSYPVGKSHLFAIATLAALGLFQVRLPGNRARKNLRLPHTGPRPKNLPGRKLGSKHFLPQRKPVRHWSRRFRTMIRRRC